VGCKKLPTKKRGGEEVEKAGHGHGGGENEKNKREIQT